MTRLALEAASGSAPSRPTEARPLSFDEVYRDHVDFLFRATRGFGVAPHVVDDVLQDVFVVVHRRLGEHDGKGAIRSWLVRILFNVVRDHRRRGRAVRARSSTLDGELDEHLTSDGHDPEQAAALAEARRTLLKILDEMDESQRTVFVLAEVEQMPVPEVAEAMGTSVNTAYSRLRLARQHFSAAVERARTKDEWRQR